MEQAEVCNLAMACKLDRHPDREELDRQMANGVNYPPLGIRMTGKFMTLALYRACNEVGQLTPQKHGVRFSKVPIAYDSKTGN